MINKAEAFDRIHSFRNTWQFNEKTTWEPTKVVDLARTKLHSFKNTWQQFHEKNTHQRQITSIKKIHDQFIKRKTPPPSHTHTHTPHTQSKKKEVYIAIFYQKKTTTAETKTPHSCCHVRRRTIAKLIKLFHHFLQLTPNPPVDHEVHTPVM